MRALIEQVCTSDDLSTYDPYDIWRTRLGLGVKKLYNRQPRIGILPAAILALMDDLANDQLRTCYTKMEHPVARAMAALCLLNLYRRDPDLRLMISAEQHLEWLLAHRCRGRASYCWGLGFPHAVSRDIVYDSNTPFSTITPYMLEAFLAISQLTPQSRFHPAIESIFRFFDRDLQVMDEDDEALATSYGPLRDRTVINAVSYTMYAHCLFLPLATGAQQQRIRARIAKLYAYIRRHQREDGSWFYSPDERSFVDCFHSCIVLKNLVKSNRIMELNRAEELIRTGYEYVIRAFLDERRFLFRRFSVRNKPGLIRYDLYDNAEVLNVARLLGDTGLARRVLTSIVHHFCDGPDVYSQIDFLGRRRRRNTLRWAVMPFLYAASQMLAGENTCTEPSTQPC